jgi:hypothetical protein
MTNTSNVPDEWKFKSLSVMQDFYSKRAAAHASFFVASVFGLFTVLRLIDNMYYSFWSKTVLALVYVSLWIMGIYSFLNFSFYASIAHNAERSLQILAIKLIDPERKKDMERQLLTDQVKDLKKAKLFRKWIIYRFFDFKVFGGKPKRKWLRRNIDLILFGAYLSGGLLALIFVWARV